MGAEARQKQALVAAKELNVMRRFNWRKEEYMRSVLPYGMWTCADGREVLFNRRYRPIWQRRPGQSTTAADENEWVPWVHQRWFYADGASPWLNKVTLKRCADVLAAWGVQIEAEWLRRQIDLLPSTRAA
jgi:hypothetical protein